MKRTLLRPILGASAAAGIALAYLALSQPPAHAFPIPQPYYTITAVSGTHHASLLNLPVGQPGVFLAPTPVDIDGDGIPDIAVSVNLSNVNGVFNNPPQIGSIIAPNIQIDRLVTAPVLGQPSKPLKITVNLTVADSTGGPATTLSFGYDTGNGGQIGSLPTYYHAIVGGLQSFFNPLQAVVDTTGTVVGLKPNINGLGLAPVAPPYQGPLHVIGGISSGSLNANLDFGFNPFPNTITATYATDAAGQHITYAHAYTGDVNLNAVANLTSNGATTNAVARVDRLPHSLKLDLGNSLGTSNSGTVDVQSSPNGRLPDVRVTLNQTPASGRPLNASLSIDALPAVLHGEWSLPQGGPAHAAFCSPAAPSPSPCTAPQSAGIGAIQAQVTNYAAGANPFPAYVSPQQQYLNFQQGGANPADPDLLITGRVERIRGLNFTQSANGIDAAAQLGDGELPLLAHFVQDGRGGSAPGPYIEGTATISPLPASAHINMTAPPPSSGQPTSLTYDASTPVDIDGAVSLFDKASGGACGTHGTICGTIKARHIPAHITTTITDTPRVTQINVDSSNPGVTAVVKPDFFADATLGTSDDLHPIVAHAQVLGFPQSMRIYAHQGANETLDDAEFHACAYDFTLQACSPATAADQIGALSFDVHNWITRPAGFPYASPATPLYADVFARGGTDPTVVQFQASGQVTNIAELDYKNVGGIAGVRVRAGGHNPFSAHVDAGNIDISPSDPTSHRFDAVADVNIPALPAAMDACFRQANKPLVVTGAAYTQSCEDTNPFGDASPLATSPMTFSYRASAPFSVTSSAKIVDHGADSSIANGGPDTIADNRTYQGAISVQNIPMNITANVAMPGTGSGPLRAKFCSGSLPPAPGSTCPGTAFADPQINVGFSASVTDADLICKDPRTPAAGQIALCADGSLNNLPSYATVLYDPTLPANNFSVVTSGQKPMDLVGTHPCVSQTPAQCFEVSGVYNNKGAAAVLIGDGAITGIPGSLTGTLHLPSQGSQAPLVDLTATPPLATVDATVTNFIAPDPILTNVPVRTTGFGTPTQTVDFFQRGPAFKAEAHIQSVAGFGFRTLTDSNGNPLDTNVVRVAFGQDQTVRAYADLEPDATSRTIADATLANIPAQMTVCFRGKNTHIGDPPAAGSATFCDGGDSAIPVNDSDGAFQVLGTPGTGPGIGPGIGVDAFVRQAGAGGTQVLSGRIHIDGIPYQIEGSFPSSSTAGDLHVGTFNPPTTPGGNPVPAGINHINVNVATFDIGAGDAGFVGAVPWSPSVKPPKGPFPLQPPADGNSYLVAAIQDGALQARGDLGPSAQLQSIQMSHNSCAAPVGSNPGAYTFFPPAQSPTNPGGPTYQCITGTFVEPNAPTPVPLDLGFTDTTGNSQIGFNGGLTNLPDTFQMTLSDVHGHTDSALPRCGAVSTSPPSDCLPPLVRFDTPATSTLFGTMKYGNLDDLATLATTEQVSTEQMVNLDEVPTGSDSSWPEWIDPSTNPHADGVRAKVSVHNGAVAVQAGVRLQIPQNLILDQVQGYSASNDSTQSEYWQASDTKIHIIVNDANGNPVGSLGEVSALFQQFDDNFQILASAPCLTHSIDPNVIPGAITGRSAYGSCPDFNRGIPIPGELGLDLYHRSHTGNGQDFMQIDGRVSQPLGNRPVDIGARLIATGEQAPVGRLEAQILNVPTTLNNPDTTPGAPTFRIREEMLSSGGSPPPSGPQNPNGSPINQPSSNCSPFLCTEAQATLQTVFGSFDFNPTGGATPARLVQAVVNRPGSTQNGVEVAAWSTIDPVLTGSSPQPPDAEVTARAFLDVNPLNVFVHAGISGLGGADLVLRSEIQATLNIVDSSDFVVRENLLHVEYENHSADPGAPSCPALVGSQTAVALGCSGLLLNAYIYLLHAEADLLFVPLLTVDFVPPSIPPAAGSLLPGGAANLAFLPCGVLGFFPTFNVSGFLANPNTSASMVIWPFDPSVEPRFVVGGLLAPIFDLANLLVAPFFCLMGAGRSDIPTIGMDTTVTPNVYHPSDPVGSSLANRAVNHPVPDAADGSSVTTPVSLPQPTGTPVSVTVGPTATYAMCGDHTFDHLYVQGKIKVTVTPSATDSAGNQVDSTGTGPDCPNTTDPTTHNLTQTGTLTIGAAYVEVENGGSIDGSAVINSNVVVNPPANDAGTLLSAVGNGGAGHVGQGGSGSQGAGGLPYGDTSNNPIVEGGVQGADAGGFGGAEININADDVLVDSGGSIVADGGDGAAGVTNCSGTSTFGAGGGSGGGIAISGTSVTDAGTIAARGGNGGNGGSGGGGAGSGGAVKVIAPLQPGPNTPLVNGGPNGGTATCSGFTNGSAGPNGLLAGSNAVESHSSPPTVVVNSQPTPEFWNQANSNHPLAVPYEEAGVGGAANGADVYLCAASGGGIDPTVFQQMQAAAPSNTPLNKLFTMPTGNSLLDPCGGSGFFQFAPVLAKVHVAADRTSGTLNVDPSHVTMVNGYWGLYTIVVVGCQGTFCSPTLQPLPQLAQTVIGIDNSAPSLAITMGGTLVNQSGNAFTTNVQSIQFTLAGQSDVKLSGFDKVLCKNENAGAQFAPCINGDNTWALSPGDGTKTITVEALNKAGVVTTEHFNGLVDTVPPVATDTVTAAPGTAETNGWFPKVPSVVLSGTDDSSGLVGFRYSIDGGSLQACNTAPTCAIPQSTLNLLTDGGHTLYFTGVDAAGNQLGLPAPPLGASGPPAADQAPLDTDSINIDTTPPKSAILTVPAQPDGANGWFKTDPWVDISAIDQPGGSGLVANLFGDNPDAGIGVYMDGTLQPSPSPFLPLGSPPYPAFRLSDGAHDVCWFALDRAGNFDVPPGPGDGQYPSPATLLAAGQCQHFKVDSMAPAVSVTPTPLLPNGSNSWYTANVPVAVSAVDGGSGVSATLVSIDGAPYVPYTPGIVIPAGLHDVRAYAVDVAGNTSDVVDLPVTVDTSPPAPAIRFTPPSPSHNGWWQTPPLVTLKAVDGDQSSGVAALQYQLDGGPWQTYTAPFTVPEGVHTVTYRATDAAGNTSPVGSATVPVDLTAPGVTATSSNPTVWLQTLSILGNILGLSPSQAQLQWKVSDNLSPHVHITVLVFNVGGAVVRQLDGGTYATTPGLTLSGSTAWDGRDSTVTGFVPVGVYYYRVVATDDAGNVQQSGESAPITIKV